MEEKRPEFSSLSDAVRLMQRITESLSETDQYYEDFRFFSAINCTTQSEYRQELKTFLEQVLSGNIPLLMEETGTHDDFAQSLEELYIWL